MSAADNFCDSQCQTGLCRVNTHQNCLFRFSQRSSFLYNQGWNMTHGGFRNYKAREHPWGHLAWELFWINFCLKQEKKKFKPDLKISINGDFIKTPRTFFQGLIITVKDVRFTSSPKLSISASNHFILSHTFICTTEESSICITPSSSLKDKRQYVTYVTYIFAEGQDT